MTKTTEVKVKYAVRDGWRDICEQVFSQYDNKMTIHLSPSQIVNITFENHSHYAYAGKRAFFDGASFGAFELHSIDDKPIYKIADISPLFEHLGAFYTSFSLLFLYFFLFNFSVS